MRTISIISLSLLLAHCAGGNFTKMKIGKRCTVSDSNQFQESSYIWFVSKDAVNDFDKRINKSNCLNS